MKKKKIEIPSGVFVKNNCPFNKSMSIVRKNELVNILSAMDKNDRHEAITNILKKFYNRIGMNAEVVSIVAPPSILNDRDVDPEIRIEVNTWFLEDEVKHD